MTPSKFTPQSRDICTIRRTPSVDNSPLLIAPSPFNVNDTIMAYFSFVESFPTASTACDASSTDDIVSARKQST
eukprot:CAMPEP_0113570654 /NCGR_PEP_ID=MMETSP0015_2-20120614/25100_1 /TAXON_ID=2838 /ORGANISM="Odontella" /LENGTH=73 /DNA_ID=CAMNT_0000473481 /DNA_START=324 /DNA_END=545 /DNA_ORIENTATION=- /assembly_acc=CAM_ASM_000160